MVEDRTTTARIRDEAMRLFADRGAAAVPLRAIAEAAGVSAPLIIHHFGSKAGLQAAVNRHVTGVVRDVIGPLGESTATQTGFGGVADLLATSFAGNPHMIGYLRRMLIDGGEAANQLFSDLHEATREVVTGLATAGLIRKFPDPDQLAAFLLVNDLALLVLRDQLRAVTGSDPVTDGLEGWTSMVMDVYASGLIAHPQTTEVEP